MIQTPPPSERFTVRASEDCWRATEGIQLDMLATCVAPLFAAVLWFAYSSAIGQEPHGIGESNPPAVDIVFGAPSLADFGPLDEEATHPPRRLATLDVERMLVQEPVLPPLADLPTEDSTSNTPAEATAACTCGRRHSRAECCPVVGPMYQRWNYDTKPRLQATHWGYPEYFIERPFGTYARHAAHVQIANGLQDQQVLYQYDFLAGPDEALLSPRGLYELEKIVRRMQFVAVPVIVQQTDRPELDDARRRNVLSALADMNFPAEPEMVVIGRPRAPGLQAIEGLIINENLLQQTLQRGGEFRTQVGGFGQ